MAQAHKATKAFLQNASDEIRAQFTYAWVFKANLVQAHKDYKAMQATPKTRSIETSKLVKGYMTQHNAGPDVKFDVNKPMMLWEVLYAVTAEGEVYKRIVDTTKHGNSHFDCKGAVWEVCDIPADTIRNEREYEYIGSYHAPKHVKIS
jgi:hypothetical protein